MQQSLIVDSEYSRHVPILGSPPVTVRSLAGRSHDFEESIHSADKQILDLMLKNSQYNEVWLLSTPSIGSEFRRSES